MQDKAFRLVVINGILFAVIIATIEPGVILSAFFLKITDSVFFATLPFALLQFGSFLSQLLISNTLEVKQLKKPYYVIAGNIRISFLVMMCLSTYFLGAKRPYLLALIFSIMYFGYAYGGGISNLTFMDIIGKAIPANRRGSLFGMRGFFGGILGLLSGFLVRYILGDSGPSFPANYSLLFVIATIFQICALLVFAAIPEPIATIRKERISFSKHLINGLSIMKTDRDYRLLFVIKVLTSMASIGGMVFIPYALKELGVHESFIGVLMVISACFALPSNFLWSHIGDKYGNKLLMIVSNGVYLAVPVISVISYYSPPMKLNVPFLSVYDLRVLIFIAAFTISSATINGRFISDMNYLLDISPEERRPSYLAFMSVLLAPTSFIPLVGGMIAELISFHVTFIVSFIFGVCAYVLMFRLNEPRKRKE